jgi:hypothetical protein
VKSKSIMKYCKVTSLVLTVLLTQTLFLTGCMSSKLFKVNKDFSQRNQKQVYFEEDVLEVVYLGKDDGAYIYGAKDAIDQEVVFRLPAESGKSVSSRLEKFKSAEQAHKKAMFHFMYGEKPRFELDDTSYFPKDVYIIRAFSNNNYNDLCNAGICEEYIYHYSCRDGAFSNSLKKVNGYGLSASDAFVFGLRNTGYLATVPLDIAAFAVEFSVALALAPVALPMAFLLKDTFRH